MATTQNPSQLIDKLQADLNLLLEQTGRFFASANTGGNGAIAAQATKLKQVAPVSATRFHASLDQLENELQLAQTVMRRDLAVYREKRQSNNPASTTTTTNGTTNGDIPNQNGVKSPEVDMTDAPTAQDDPSSAPKTTQIKEETSPPDQKPSPTSPDEKAPDIAPTSNPADLESLFNGSAGGDKESKNGDDPTSTSNNDNDNDFDFGAFNDSAFDTANNNDDSNPTESKPTTTTTTDANAPESGNPPTTTESNDNISALLPGLQDYANTQSSGNDNTTSGGGDVDFDALFAAPEGEGGDGNVDTTFDDLMNFTDFTGTGDYGNNSGTGDDNFDFDFS